MSNEENTEQQTVESSADVSSTSTDTGAGAKAAAADSAKDKVGGIVTIALELKEKNPKVFFGAIGGIVLLILIAIMSGGGSTPAVKGQEMKNLVKGNKYILKSANGYEASAPVRLVSSPDNIAAYDDTEEADRSSPCQHIPQGTAVTVLELQDMYGTKNAFAKVQMEEGDCKGKDGWVLSIDVQ
jgi:hypothetical protein